MLTGSLIQLESRDRGTVEDPNMRRAFTLVELLVVIAIIGVLVALLLPAVQAAREAARRTQCKNNLKNIGLSLQNYESAFKFFPTGGTTFGERLECFVDRGKPFNAPKQGMSWAFQLLPFLEQGALQNVGATDVVQNTPVPLYNCPSRRGPTQYAGKYGTAYLMDYGGATPCTFNNGNPGATKFDAERDHGNFDRVGSSFWMVGAGGYSGGQPPNNGVYDGVIVRSPWRRTAASNPTACGPNPAPGEFAANVPMPTKMAQISDGTSNTLVVSEKYIQATGEFGYVGGDASDDRGWLDGWDPDTMRSTCARPLSDGGVSEIRDSAGEDQTYPFGSAHASGMNAVFADGSVRTISFDVAMYVFNSLGTRNGEAVGETTQMDGVN
jgi:prepilin-type N-terminal cleavage/methylation domain-containing protein/prepilin-type processing-associated H-X9-DG protein